MIKLKNHEHIVVLLIRQPNKIKWLYDKPLFIHLGAKIEGLYRQDIYELPPSSIRELIINAVMNCSFLQSSHIQVAIFDDRLEITSPGGLMSGVTIDRMKEGYSQIRNHALAHAFSYMNLIEGWGTGIPRLMKEMKEYGLDEPEFIDMEMALRINLYRKSITEENTRVPDNNEILLNHAGECRKVPDNAGECRTVLASVGTLSEQHEVIYKKILDKGSITSSEVEKLFGVKQRRARAILSEMVHNGIIKK